MAAASLPAALLRGTVGRSLGGIGEGRVFDELMEASSGKMLKTYRVSTAGVSPERSTSPASNRGGPAATPPSLARNRRWWRSATHTPPLSGSGFPNDDDLPCIVGRRSAAWLDDIGEYCYLCAAPMPHGKSFHLGFDRDHIALNAFVYLSVMYPRSCTTHHVHATALRGAGAAVGGIARYALPGAASGVMLSMDARNPTPSTPDDAMRLAELSQLLHYLSDGPAHHRVLSDALYDGCPPGLTGQGEKICRAIVTQLVVAAFPPFGPNIQAAFSQKAWGRTNLMGLYDELGLGEFQRARGLTMKTDRSDKSSVVRQVAVELALASTHGPRAPGAAGRSAHPREIDPVAVTLAELALQRLAFEAVLRKSRQYMHQAQQAVAWAGYPTPDQLVYHEYS